MIISREMNEKSAMGQVTYFGLTRTGRLDSVSVKCLRLCDLTFFAYR